MHAYMNRDALKRIIEIGEAFYWSRSRQQLWHKGPTSGLKITKFLIHNRFMATH